MEDAQSSVQNRRARSLQRRVIWLLLRVSLVPILLAVATVAILSSHSVDQGERAGITFFWCLFGPVHIGLWIMLFRRRSMLRNAWKRG